MLDRWFDVTTSINSSNQLHMDNLGVSSNANSFISTVSSSRTQMYTSHIAQQPVLLRSEPMRILSGTEREYGKYTFMVKMPERGEVRFILDKYPVHGEGKRFKRNPEQWVIYQARCNEPKYLDSAYYGVVEINDYCSHHQHFGFMYDARPALHALSVGSTIPAGEKLCVSPNLKPDGNYHTTVQANVIFVSHHSVIEDGMCARDEFLPNLTATGIESRAESSGSKRYPINLHGNSTIYKGHPDLGEMIPDHGILFAMREYDPILAVVEMTPEALRKPDYVFDKLVYGRPGATIIDVNVMHDHNLSRPLTPVGIEAQANYYYEQTQARYTKLMRIYDGLTKQHGNRLHLQPALHRLVVEAHAYLRYTGYGDGGKVNLTYRRNPLDEWRTEITFSYPIRATIGSKVTDRYGGKGIITSIKKTKDMFRDQDGNVADLARDNDSVIKRMNIGGPYEHAYTAFMRQMTIDIQCIMDDKAFAVYNHRLTAEVTAMCSVPGRSIDDRYKAAWDRVFEFYNIISPYMGGFLGEVGLTGLDIQTHINSIVQKGIYIWLPSHTPDIGANAILALRNRYGLRMSVINYTDEEGNAITTVDEMLISEMSIMLLEKNGTDWASVASPKRQHFGILSRLTDMDKYSTPGRENAVRITGEAEIRLLLALLSSMTVADILDRPNNPTAHKEEVRSILHSETPFNIDLALDRKKIPVGGNRAIQFIKHLMRCCGIEMKRWVE